MPVVDEISLTQVASENDYDYDLGDIMGIEEARGPRKVDEASPTARPIFWFEFRRKDLSGIEDVLGISLADLDAGLNVDIDFSDDLKAVVGNLQELTIDFPDFFNIDIQNQASNISFDAEAKEIKMTNLTEEGAHFVIRLKGLIFPETGVEKVYDHQNTLYYSPDSVAMKAEIWLDTKFDVAAARANAKGIGKQYEDLNLIICHLGGGISVAAHEKGKAIDANNALDGEGPFSPERAGSLPAVDLIRLCFSGKYNEQQLLKRIAGKAGLNAHLGTNDMREILKRIQHGDEHAKLIVDAMIYHVAKNIAAEGAVLCGKVDAILLTGGLAHSEYIISELRRRIGFLAPVYTFPGEDEMEALALNALAVLQGKREAKIYV